MVMMIAVTVPMKQRPIFTAMRVHAILQSLSVRAPQDACSCLTYVTEITTVEMRQTNILKRAVCLEAVNRHNSGRW